MPDTPLGRDESRELRDAIRELAKEMRAFRQESERTFVRRDTHLSDIKLLTETHNKDVQLLIESHNKDMELVTQALTAQKEAADTQKKNMDDQVETERKRVDKIENDADWTKKIVYAAIIVAFLAAAGIYSSTTAGIFK